jgi:NADH-quinone oxidoreductase subunit D
MAETVKLEKELRDPSSSIQRINMGPAHPAMHGVIRLILDLDGEKIVGADMEIGYLHRAFEKKCEQGSYTMAIPYTDRLNYVSPLINNVGYVMTVEKLMGITTTERCQYIRVIMSEMSRITDHQTCIAAGAMESGAMTVFLYLMEARECLYEIIEDVTGARLTISYARVGGLKADLPQNFEVKIKAALKKTREINREVEKLLFRNRIFVDRMSGTGKISKERALSYGITGPFLRSTGSDYDVRKAHPYLVYDRMNFDIPVGRTGDNLDRYYVRMEEMVQSMRIIEQALQELPGGNIQVDDQNREIPAHLMVDQVKLGGTEGVLEKTVHVEPTLQGSTKPYYNRIYAPRKDAELPAKEDTYGNIEGLMNHFKMVMYGHGIRPPKGEAYFPVEGANGELGFYIVSDGTDRPYRVHCRPPCFNIMAALPEILVGDLISDVIATFGTVNMIAGELDR